MTIEQPASPPDHVARIQREWMRERPDVDVRPQGVIGRLHRVGMHLTEAIVEVYARHGLGEGEFDVLAALRRAGHPFERVPGELAAHTMVTTGAITKRVDRLERAGLVMRRAGEHDGRSRVVGLTDAGLTVIDEVFTEHMANERDLLEGLSEQQVEQLESLLTTWLARFEG
jgi:DNA-binding MarR family transcriptional regulator